MLAVLRLLALALILSPLAGSADAYAQRARYYMVMFGAEGMPSLPRNSHTFATFVKSEGGRITQELTISWLPAMGHFGPNYTMPPLSIVPGRNYTLDETIALSPGRRTSFIGPMEITPALFERAANRVAFLHRGGTSYKMMILLRDRLREPALTNRPGGAINCIMAVSDLGGYYETGTSYGWGASEKVLGLLSREVLRRPYEAAQDVAAQMNLHRRIGR